MATSVDLARISALVNRLLPLSQAAGGELIRAQDWNTVVAALMELAQTVVASPPTDTVPPHDHLEQVKLDWLEPKMKALVQGGPLNDPSAIARVAATERASAALDARLDAVNADSGQLRAQVTQLAGRDLTRESQLQTVNLTMSGLGEARDDVAALRASLAATQASVGVAIAVGQKLTVDGQPANLQGLSDRLGALEGFRDGLRGPSGAVLDATTLANQVQQATEGLVTSAQLAIAIAQRPVTVPADQLQALGDQLSASIKNDVTATVSQLANDIRAQTDQRLGGVDALVARAVADALPSLGETLLGKVRPEITAAVQAGVSNMQAQLEKRLGETTQALRAEVGGQLSDLRLELNNNLRDQVQKEVKASFDSVQKGLADLSARVDRNDAAITANQAATSAVGIRVEAVAQADATARTVLQTTLAASTADQIKAVNAHVDAQIASTNATLGQRISDVNRRVGVNSPIRPG